MLAADAAWPGTGRAAWIRASNAWNEPRSASTDIAAAMSAARARRAAASTASASTAALACVPLISARPSLGRERDRPQAGAREGVGARQRSRRWYSASPSPTSTSARCASGARSPLAPTEPRDGTRGCTPALSSATSASSVSRRMPEKPFASTFARSAISARTTGAGSGSPTPAAWLRNRLSCSAASWSRGNRDVGERAEAGVDAVDRAAARRVRVHDRARGADALARAASRGRRARASCAMRESASSVSEDPSSAIIVVPAATSISAHRVSFYRHESVCARRPVGR